MSSTSFMILKPNGQGARQAPPRDLKPGQAAPPTNREVDLQKVVDAGTVNTVEPYIELARLQEQRRALSEAEATLLASRRVAGAEARALQALAAFYLRTNKFDKAVAAIEEIAEADPANPKVHQLVATYYWEAAFKNPTLTPQQKMEYIQAGIAATDRALSYDSEYVEALTYKNILLRMQANLETDKAKQAQLIAEADALRNKAMELNKARGGIVGGVVGGVPGGVVGGVPGGVSGGVAGEIRSDMPPPPPPPPPPPGPPVEVDGQAAVRVGGNIAPPTKVKDVRPVYPPEAMGAKVQGVVILEAVIDSAGDVRSAKVLRSIPLLDEAAVAAVEQWKFVPTLLNGVAVPVVMTVTVNFTLQ
jgi:TonB family protein